jgi:hypothetical protein
MNTAGTLAATGLAVVFFGPAAQCMAQDSATQSERLSAGGASQPDCITDGRLGVGAARLELTFPDSHLRLERSQIRAWVKHAADAVRHYYGRFPVAAARLELKAIDGREVSGGTTYGRAGSIPLIVIRLGRDAGESALDRDWVMAHELVHLSIPAVPAQSHWLEEGIATSVEPITRAQVGQLSSERVCVWGDMVTGLPHGMPGPGDHGLDHTPTWGAHVLGRCVVLPRGGHGNPQAHGQPQRTAGCAPRRIGCGRHDPARMAGGAGPRGGRRSGRRAGVE